MRSAKPSFFVMPGQEREARLRADVPGIHVFLSDNQKAWMAGTSPAMTQQAL
jgi:hypothetical protein